MKTFAAEKPFRLPWYKRSLQQSLVQRVLAYSMAALLRLTWFSFRLTKEVDPNALPYLRGEHTGIFCFWHGRMILLPFFMPKGKRMHVLISKHRDGELIARMISHFGIEAIRGSSSKGARDAMRAMIEVLQQEQNISITPDGPRGPAFKASRGALHIAKVTQKPIIPVTFAASHGKHLRSWDSFLIPYPFASIKLKIGAPIAVSEDAGASDIEKARKRLEDTLNSITDDADARQETI